MRAAAIVVVVAQLVAASGLLVHALVQLRLLAAARAAARTAPPPPPGELPFVTVQLPVFNERLTVCRLLDAVAALDYPRERLAVQVLDDSTDETSSLVDRWIGRRTDDLDVCALRRTSREGFKAGALRAALERTRPGLIAVFDADFVPRPDFLLRTVGHFRDPHAGVVQARWMVANRNDSLVARTAALMLDAHFDIEQRGRAALGCFVGFNGTAGVWRTEAIRQAGGWSDRTLTEDVDLSFRAQLSGWRVVYEPGVTVPCEVPAGFGAFRIQQRRWNKGVAQNARRLAPRVLRTRRPTGVRLLATAQLLETCVYLALAATLLLWAPVVWFAARGDVPWPLAADPPLLLALLLLLPSYRHAWTSATGDRSWPRFAREYAGFIAVAFALVVPSAAAVLDGLLRDGGEFVRTPKGARLESETGQS
ncbi:MAG TPA: glycosyltransferase family 2 protein [Kribbellaceae bacterium]